ncbi:hypothetical protein GFC29_2203 [Anoxybacillus sp. B7M1]|uniref:hypothetical protein n=1 Tax=unclassified Anoxybacillus TaxID=2639704 RepID=UPI0005CD5BA8|nr:MULTISPECIES: hypothetical protein [unclassified Anoxybacillus]ANB57648.1 hypothetical protein GFC28_3231 [Anoxybacillus sp. B2M1]ANB66063.1 hypothetical protein GFC29_2203 [Anoxybacillus sp. B7M1]OQM44607.1 hypothetical protein B6A27_15895 [Anoxybacillus sp. UARK-01]
MKNVVIHKIVTLIFTEEQLKAYWEKKKTGVPFVSLTNEQYMKLAEEMLQHSSHSQLQQHLIDQGWRTKEEAEGLVVAEDDSREAIHVEMVDTSIPQRPSHKLFIDRLTEVQCSNCQFMFYTRDIENSSPLLCPSCGQTIQ